jgi:hypothetical protein
LSNGSSNFKQGFKIEPDYYTVANLKFISHSNGIEVANYSRVIGNDVSGGAVLVDGTGIIVLRRNGSKALGNAVHGGRSGSRLDHGIYISGCAAMEGNYVGWNHIYDNSFDRGPLIVVNHQGNRCSSDVFVKSHHIYNNFVDCSQYPSRGIGLYDLSWDGGSETEPEPTYVYGNVVLSCGVDDGNYDHPAVYQGSAHEIWYNNSIVDTRTRGAVLGGNLSSEFVNNIVTLRSSDYDYVNENPIVSIKNNIFHGAGTPAESTTNSYHVDPGFNINTTTLQASLDSTSPARNRGITPLNFHQFDINGNDRVIGERIDIGAVEFYLAPPNPPVQTSRLLNILSGPY